MKRLSLLLAIFLYNTAVIIAISYSADWPQFLGPERNSTSPQTNLLRSWA